MNDTLINHGSENILLSVEKLICSYSVKSGFPLSVLNRKKVSRDVIHRVSFSVNAGETYALVGESGSGKTTIMRAVGGLLKPTGGQIFFNGLDITCPVEKRTLDLCRQIQIVFQNPDSSLNPRRKIDYAVGRPFTHFLKTTGKPLEEKIEQALSAVNLDPVYARRYPTQLSKGERQRVAIARALAADPTLMLCDEVLSSLDVSVQAGILDLLIALQNDRRLTYLFISHDLAVVRTIAHHVGVLYLGHLCEIGTVEEVFAPPFHPYTEVLLMAIPRPVPGVKPPEIVLATGELRAFFEKGCAFATRCPRKIGPICENTNPPMQLSETGHGVLCHIPVNELINLQS
jgi:peptide/nickel transport system ATP-binding protein